GSRAGVPAWTIPNLVRAGRLVRFLPGVYGLPSASPVRAAGLYVEGRGGISHTSALAVWGLCEPPPHIHITVPPRCRIRASNLEVHVRESLIVGPPDIIQRDGLPVTALDDTLVAAWPILLPVDRTAAMIRAVNDRLTLPIRIAAAIGRAQRLGDRAAM